MSKSIWCDAIETKPVRRNDKPNFSINVLYWLEGQEDPIWGYYNHLHGVWVDGHARQVYDPQLVKYFAYIDNPYK